MPDPNNEPNNNEELVLEDVVKVVPEELSDDQKTFIKKSQDDLTDEQKETYKGVLEEEEEPIDIKKIKIETRVPRKTKPKEKPPIVEEEEEIAPEDERAISKVVDKKLKPLTEAQQEQLKRSQKLADEQETDAFIRENPDYSKYRGVILKYLAHPAYKNIPVSNIAAIVSSQDQQKIGAKKEREAAKKAAETKAPGSSARPVKGKGPDWHTAPAEDFQKKRTEVMERQGD